MKTLISGAETVLRDLQNAADDAATLVKQIAEFRTEYAMERKAKRKPRNGDPGPKSISDLFRF